MATKRYTHNREPSHACLLCIPSSVSHSHSSTSSDRNETETVKKHCIVFEVMLHSAICPVHFQFHLLGPFLSPKKKLCRNTNFVKNMVRGRRGQEQAGKYEILIFYIYFTHTLHSEFTLGCLQHYVISSLLLMITVLVLVAEYAH